MSRRSVSAREFRASGLLRQANEATFWPIGFALAVDVEKDEITLMRVDPYEAIEPNDAPGERRAAAEALETYLRERFS